MNFVEIAKNPLVLAFGKEMLDVLIGLIKSLVIPRVKRKAFEKMSEGMQEFGEFILEQKTKVEATETIVDDEAYKLSREAFKKFLDEANALYSKM